MLKNEQSDEKPMADGWRDSFSAAGNPVCSTDSGAGLRASAGGLPQRKPRRL